MYFSEVLAVVVRRWYIVVVATVLMAAAAIAVISVVPTEYQASGQVLLLPPSEPQREGSRINPYLSLPNGVTFTATLIANGATQPSVARDLARAGFDSPYSVSVVPNTGPLIIISVKDSDPSAALLQRDELIQRIEGELDRIQEQDDVSDNQRIAARRFNTSDVAEVLAGAKLRALGALGALGIVLTAIAVFGVERWSTRRGQRRAARRTRLDADSLSSTETADGERLTEPIGRTSPDDDPSIESLDWVLEVASSTKST
jgi:capsular polysaccharide biosynthesis protein